MLRKMRADEFDAVYALIERSFPKDEFRSYSEQSALLDDPKFVLYVLPSETGGIVAFASVYEFDEFCFIEHLAVAPDRRDRGVGSAVLKELFAAYGKPICLEAELPDTEIAARRIEFYRRNGFYTNARDYTQPPLSADKNPVPIVLLTYYGAVSDAKFDRIVETIYKYVYKVGTETKP